MLADTALQAELDVARLHAFFPILPKLGNRWAEGRPWAGKTIGLNLHLTPLTAALVRELMLGGGEWAISAADPATIHPGAVNVLRDLGANVYTGGDMLDRHLQVLAHNPTILGDVGFALTGTLLDRRPDQASSIEAVVEISRSGIERLHNRDAVPFPVVNINDGRLRDAVENRHGVGEGVWRAVGRLTGIHLAGRRVVVLGYGAVGRGLAAYARAAHMSVTVVEKDPVRALFAHYDGYPTEDLPTAIRHASFAVTATGHPQAITVESLANARSGIVLLNAGHGGDEIDVAGLEDHATTRDHVADQVVTYQLEDRREITVLGGGKPLNIVTNSGSPEPVLLHFTVLGLTLEWVARFGGLEPGECIVPEEIETRAAILALEALQPGVY